MGTGIVNVFLIVRERIKIIAVVWEGVVKNLQDHLLLPQALMEPL